MSTLDVKSYALVTAAYWGFTLTDGALRMLVLLYFHQLDYSPVSLAFLFLLYEICGVVTNLFGGWIGSRFGLNVTLFAGLAIQIVALTMLSLLQPNWLAGFSIAYVMVSQALSGVAKDLTKMSSKSAVKLIVKEASEDESDSALFRWVAILTGSKNALKGVGFFLGGVLLDLFGFSPSLWLMAGGLVAVFISALVFLKKDMGKSKEKVRFAQLFSKSNEINVLSLARLFLFGSRDVWFVVGLPVFLASKLGWSFAGVGGFMSAWVIGYGVVQGFAPQLVGRRAEAEVGGRVAFVWSIALFAVSIAIALAVQFDIYPTMSVLVGLAIFGFVFAINSSVHSYLILAYTDSDKVALNVGFYYTANACGRMLGTLFSGVAYLLGGLNGCLWTSTIMVLVAVVVTFRLP